MDGDRMSALHDPGFPGRHLREVRRVHQDPRRRGSAF